MEEVDESSSESSFDSDDSSNFDDELEEKDSVDNDQNQGAANYAANQETV